MSARASLTDFLVFDQVRDGARYTGKGSLFADGGKGAYLEGFVNVLGVCGRAGLDKIDGPDFTTNCQTLFSADRSSARPRQGRGGRRI